jgi:hypothetical protein
MRNLFSVIHKEGLCPSNGDINMLMIMIVNTNVKIVIEYIEFEELDGRAVSALGVRSRKLSTGLNGQS